ncbi:MAG: hypothetical protein EOP10_25800 [Proteobacteria bacterium]|nr:MAG: hypothetical protein EOP10_25800 [Pseudomonadota bacterium]
MIRLAPQATLSLLTAVIAVTTLSVSVSACKILPGTVRSGTETKKVDAMLQAESLSFVRNADQTSGNLSFSLKDQHQCRIEYWSQDPTGTPPPASPLSIDCPKDKLQLTQAIAISGLTPGYPLSFRIFVWPKTTTFLSHYVKDFSEGQDLQAKTAQDLVVVRYLAPRQSAEIYSFRFPGTISVSEIKSKLNANTQSCVERPVPEALPFPRSSSLEDNQKRPLLGLSQVKTEGFGSGEALQHPFFNTRLIETYEQTARQENWKWNFAWENKPFSFDAFPPGYIGELTVGDGQTSRSIATRSLSGNLETVELTANRLQLSPRIIFPTDVARFDLTIKSADASETLLTCQFAIDKDSFSVPEEFLRKLGQGSYLATFTFETHQVHVNQQGSYPPWVISAQDVISFRLNKRL